MALGQSLYFLMSDLYLIDIFQVNSSHQNARQVHLVVSSVPAGPIGHLDRSDALSLARYTDN